MDLAALSPAWGQTCVLTTELDVRFRGSTLKSGTSALGYFRGLRAQHVPAQARAAQRIHELGPPCVDLTNPTTNMAPLGSRPHSRGSVSCCRGSLAVRCGSLCTRTSTGSDRSKKLDDFPCASRLNDEFARPPNAPRSTKFSPL